MNLFLKNVTLDPLCLTHLYSCMMWEEEEEEEKGEMELTLEMCKCKMMDQIWVKYDFPPDQEVAIFAFSHTENGHCAGSLNRFARNVYSFLQRALQDLPVSVGGSTAERANPQISVKSQLKIYS